MPLLYPDRFGYGDEAVYEKPDPATVDESVIFVNPAEQIDFFIGLLFTYGVGFTVTITVLLIPGGHPKASGEAV